MKRDEVTGLRAEQTQSEEQTAAAALEAADEGGNAAQVEAVLDAQERQEAAQEAAEDVERAVEETQALEDGAPAGEEGAPPAVPPAREMVQDITRIAWPSLTEMILVSLAGIVDTLMVGRVHPLAIAAVGLTNQPKLILQACFFAFNVGATALIARFRGAGNQRDANLVMRQSLMITFFVSMLLSVVGYIFAEPLVVFMGAGEPQTIAWALTYLRIQMVGFTFQALSMSVTASLRGVGNTRASMVLNVTSNVVNVIFNYCLIYGRLGFPRWGVAGASLATIMGQFVAFVGAFYILYRKGQYVFLVKGDSFRPDMPIIKRITRIGLPSMFEQLCMRVGMTAFVKVITGLGDVAFATHQIGMSMMNLSFMNGQAFGVAATTLVGQSLGKKQPRLAHEYARWTARMGQALSLLIALAFIVLRRQLVGMFMGDAADTGVNPADIIAAGAQILIVLAAMQPFQSSQLVLAGALRGAGDTRYTAVVIFVGMLLIRPLFAYTAVNILHAGLVGAWIAMLCDQFTRFVLVRLRFNSGKWTTVKV